MILLLRIPSKNIFTKNKHSLFFVYIGLSASLPLLVTLEQRAFYLTTSIPYFILALALWTRTVPSSLHEKLAQLKINYLTLNRILVGAILIVTLSFSFTVHIPKRDRDLIHDVRLIGKTIPPGTRVSIPELLAAKWNYHAYFMRYDQISLDANGKHAYFLSEKNQIIPTDSCFKKVDLPLIKFSLFTCE
jgi:hypothetical protein